MSWVTWPTWPQCLYMVKTVKKSSSPEAIDWWPWNLVCSFVYASTTKVVQIMTLGWPWSILRQGQIWSHRLIDGKKWKLFIFLETIAALGLKVSWGIQLNEFMNWVSIKGRGPSDFNVKTYIFSKTFGRMEPKFIWKFKGEWEWKFIQMSWVTKP